MSASNSKGSLLPLGVVLAVFGALLLIDGLMDFRRYGLGWIVHRENMLLYAAVIYLFIGNAREVGIVLFLAWLFLNLSVFSPLFAGVPYYIVPACLLVAGVLLMLFNMKK